MWVKHGDVGGANEGSEGQSGKKKESRTRELSCIDPVFRGLAIRDYRGMSWLPGEYACHKRNFLKI